MTVHLSPIAMLAVLAFGFAAGAASAQPAPAVAREVLDRTDIGGGQEAILGRSSMAAGADSGRHIHHGVELVTVIEGTIEVAIDGKPTKTYGPGQAFLVPREIPHDVRNVGGTPVRLAPVWVVDKGSNIADPVK